MFSRQESETYLACGEADVWVGNARFEADGGRGEGVVGRYFDVELPKAAFVSFSQFECFKLRNS